VWDFEGGQAPLSTFWRAVRETDPDVEDESERAGAREGHLVELFESAGLREVIGHELWVAREHSGFDDWWEPFTAGVGPAGAYVAGLDPEGRASLVDRLHKVVPDGPFEMRARAWAVRGIA
jgi:hypothetical protein